MAKDKVQKEIRKIKIGKIDKSGNEIINILAKGDEYAIYEINHSDINNRLHVYINGKTKKRETKLIRKFNFIKQEYMNAKGHLYKSTNFGMMKNRIAHTVATALTTQSKKEEKKVKSEFNNLLHEIEKEQEDIIKHRKYYLMPSFISLLIISLITLLSYLYYGQNVTDMLLWPYLLVLLSSSLGGSLSILINTVNLHFGKFKNSKSYIIFGLERICLAYVAGAITFILLKANILFNDIINTNLWVMMSILIITSFSEVLIPSVLSKITKK